MKDEALGKDVELPPAPFVYQIMQYRRIMHLSLDEVRAMRPEDLTRDLQMLGLEAEFGPSSIKPSTPESAKM